MQTVDHLSHRNPVPADIGYAFHRHTDPSHADPGHANCSPHRHTAPASRPATGYRPYVGDIFDSQYNPTLRLLRESPTSFPNRYWLATDNLWAKYPFTATGRLDEASDLRASMARYGDMHHGLVEVLLIGEIVAWPPQTAITVTLTPQVDVSADAVSAGNVTVNIETCS